MAPVLCLAFDGTIVRENIAEAMLERFAPPALAELRDSYQRGMRSTEEYRSAAIELIDALAGELAAFALSLATPRDGLHELLDWTHWNGWQTVVVSAGWDVYVDPILDQLGVDRVLRQCGRARRTYRWRVQYVSPRGVQVLDGFTGSFVASYREQGDFVVFAGSDTSDAEAAGLAHAVFARDGLEAACDARGLPVHRFESLHDIRSVLASESKAWLASFFSTTAAEG